MSFCPVVGDDVEGMSPHITLKKEYGQTACILWFVCFGFMGYLSAGFPFMIYYFLLHLTAQYIVLRQYVEAVSAERIDKITDPLENEVYQYKVKKWLTECIKHHQSILE